MNDRFLRPTRPGFGNPHHQVPDQINTYRNRFPTNFNQNHTNNNNNANASNFDARDTRQFQPSNVRELSNTSNKNSNQNSNRNSNQNFRPISNQFPPPRIPPPRALPPRPPGPPIPPKALGINIQQQFEQPMSKESFMRLPNNSRPANFNTSDNNNKFNSSGSKSPNEQPIRQNINIQQNMSQNMQVLSPDFRQPVPPPLFRPPIEPVVRQPPFQPVPPQIQNFMNKPNRMPPPPQVMNHDFKSIQVPVSNNTSMCLVQDKMQSHIMKQTQPRLLQPVKPPLPMLHPERPIQNQSKNMQEPVVNNKSIHLPQNNIQSNIMKQTQPQLLQPVKPPLTNLHPVRLIQQELKNIQVPVSNNKSIHLPQNNMQSHIMKQTQPQLVHPIKPPLQISHPVMPIQNAMLHMQNLNPIFPSNIISTESADDMKAQYQDLMKEQVDKWLAMKQFDLSKENKSETQLLKLHNYKLMLTKYVNQIEELRSLNDQLAENLDAENDKWEELDKKVCKLKDDIHLASQKLFNKPQVEYIERIYTQRKKKRARIKRMKQQKAAEHVATLTKRIRLNEKIDEWQHQEQRKLVEKKMVDNLKNEAGESLQEVKKKQNETNELIKTVKLLKELRDLRKDTAIYKGILVTSKDTEKFNTKVDNIVTLLEKQIEVYENEEKALRVLREEETEELNRIQIEKMKKRKQNRQSDIHKFDPMFPFRLYWLQAEDNIPSLIHVRSLWDMYTCPVKEPGSSRIPKGWVKASPPCNEKWRKYLLISTSSRKRKKEGELKRKSLLDNT